MHYTLKDQQGSLTATICGNTVERLSYDAWGRRRDPNGFGYGNVTHTFDRGYTLHEHYDDFGLINMNGRMYDPVMSSFLSVDAFVDDPTSAQGFNRYAYCMHNPLRYTDPSGWRKQGREPTSGNYENWSMRYVQPVYEPRDFVSPLFLLNQSLYGNSLGMDADGGISGGGGFSSGNYLNSYGYYVTHLTNGLYNYCFGSTQLQLILNWKNNPCRTTSNEVEEAGIGYVSVGLTQFGNGRQSSYITWTDASGTTRYAETHNEYIGGRGLGSYCFSFNPIYTHSNSNNSRGLNNANILAQSLGVPMGTINEGMEMAAKSYHNVPLLKVNSGLSKTQKMAALTKEGNAILRASGAAGTACGVLSAGISIYQGIEFYSNGGKGLEVAGKTIADVGVVIVGLLGGPVGLAVSIGYLVTDWATDGFEVSYEIKP